ncbi:MAG: UPF0158 family protein [Candidatus Symbiothrix sp.]|jgi:hypothetical protein|nr:UPF0158 family protein [Candidatus Symbiothrix sp.]
MNAQQLLNQVLSHVRSIMDDKEKLAKLLAFMEKELFQDEKKIEQDEYDYKEKLPEEYRDIVRRIADGLSANLICFFNPDTLELEDIPKNLLDEMIFDEDDEESEEENEFGLTYMKWEKCVEIEPLESHESFRIMEAFVNQLKSGKEANRLAQVVNGHKPFANFNHLIHNSEYRDDWFAFRQRKLEKQVIENYFYEYIENEK